MNLNSYMFLENQPFFVHGVLKTLLFLLGSNEKMPFQFLELAPCQLCEYIGEEVKISPFLFPRCHKVPFGIDLRHTRLSTTTCSGRDYNTHNNNKHSTYI